MNLSDQLVLIVSNEPWGDVWYSKHNYAFELSRQNTVYFVNPVMRRWRLSDLFVRNRISCYPVSDRLFVLNYSNILPSSARFLIRLNNRLVSRSVRKFFKRHGLDKFIFWSFDPFRLYKPELLDANYSIFHSVDKYNFKPIGEKALVKSCNLVICVSDEWLPDYRNLNPSSVVIGHAISGDEFVTDPSGQFKDKWGTYGVYVGGIDGRIDYVMLEQALIRFPHVNFVFVGKLNLDKSGYPARHLFLEKKYPNLISTGQVHFKELRHYIADAAFGIAFMNRNFPGNTIAHQKIVQYLAMGKPVFSCRLSDYQNLGHLLYMDDDYNGLLNQMEILLNHGEPRNLKQDRINYARQFTFENILTRISELMEGSKP